MLVPGGLVKVEDDAEVDHRKTKKSVKLAMEGKSAHTGVRSPGAYMEEAWVCAALQIVLSSDFLAIRTILILLFSTLHHSQLSVPHPPTQLPFLLVARRCARCEVHSLCR